jgi:GT2 family glycosyltransferase
MRVIIPSKNVDNLNSCLASLNVDPKDLIIINDGLDIKLVHPPTKNLPANAGVGQVINIITGIKPFVWSRNINLGIKAAGEEDVVILGDDCLITAGSLYDLERIGKDCITSAAIDGEVGNWDQWVHYCYCKDQSLPKEHTHLRLRFTRTPIAFVCVFLPRKILTATGPFDEDFIGYGFDDIDYCIRAGGPLAITDGVVVNHQMLPSTFRTDPDVNRLTEINRRIFERKHPPGQDSVVIKHPWS